MAADAEGYKRIPTIIAIYLSKNTCSNVHVSSDKKSCRTFIQIDV